MSLKAPTTAREGFYRLETHLGKNRKLILFSYDHG
jgi:hypothetical protein